LGLRIEGTKAKGEQADTAIFSKDYTELFPTLFLSYKWAEHSVNFNYGRRIGRPDYMALNPFNTPRDKYTYRTGDPFLKPEFSHNYEVSYNYRNMFTLGAFYNSLKDGMEETVTVKQDTFYYSLANIGKKRILGFSGDGTFPVTKWWTVNPAVVFTYRMLNTPGINWEISATHQFSFEKGWNAEMMIDYTTPRVYAQFVQAASWNIHMGVSKKIWKDNGAIKLNFRDVFYTRVDRQDFSHLKGVNGFTSRRWDTRNATLTFEYRTSKGLKSRSPRRMGAGEEIRRIGEP